MVSPATFEAEAPAVSPEVLAALQAALPSLVKRDSPAAFQIFYEAVTNRLLPPHAQEWIKGIYAARARGKPVLLEAFRGSTKTTTVTQLFTAYQIGLHPTRSNLLIQAGDDSANENTAYIADLIDHNPIWKLCFPNVVPDKAQGWGAKGYEVQDTSVDYGEFRRQRQKDPTLLGLGYKSNEIIGKHPNGLLIVDDIVTEEAASSEIELRRVVKTFSSSILPTRAPNDPWFLVVGTPWNGSDVLAKAKETGEFVCLRTPIYVEAKPGKGVEYLPKTGQFVRITWPEMWTVEKIEKERRLDLTGGPEFDRMFLLVLGSGLKRQLAYMIFPSYAVGLNWPTAGGCDPIEEPAPGARMHERHHFALAYVAKIPTGGAVVTGGVLEQCDINTGLGYIRQAQAIFPGWLGCMVEGGGTNEGFVRLMLLAPDLLVIPEKTGNKNKAERIVKGVGAWTRVGRVRVSDARSPFLDSLRQFAESYPNVSLSDSGWDAWDAVYWALKLLPDVLTMPSLDGDLQPRARLRGPNPFNSLGGQTYN